MNCKVFSCMSSSIWIQRRVFEHKTISQPKLLIQPFHPSPGLLASALTISPLRRGGHIMGQCVGDEQLLTTTTMPRKGRLRGTDACLPTLFTSEGNSAAQINKSLLEYIFAFYLLLSTLPSDVFCLLSCGCELLSCWCDSKQVAASVEADSDHFPFPAHFLCTFSSRQ